MNRIEKLMPAAFEAISKYFKCKPVPPEYKGYISSLGGTIRQIGLIPALANFENAEANTQAKKDDLSKIILKVVLSEESGYKDEYKDCKKLFDLAKGIYKKDENYSEYSLLKKRMYDAIVAVKFTLRAFIQCEENSKEDNDNG